MHVYLQFDGFDDATHLAIRGRRLQEVKQAALDRCDAAGVGVSLAAAVERGIAVPCCSPTCRSATYALYDGEDLVPLPRLVDVARYLGFVTNRAVPDVEVADALAGLFSARVRGLPAARFGACRGRLMIARPG